MGIERVLELLKVQGRSRGPSIPDAYAIVVDASAMATAMQCLQVLRSEGVCVQMHAGTSEGLGSIKSQFKRADSSGARFALVFGPDEIASGTVTVKSLRDGSGAQIEQVLNQSAQWAKSLQSSA
jgi:histidyl-tRNA synthetase